MELHTKYHGVRDYKEEDVITFKKGIPGFEEYSKFILFPVEENEVFYILHSVQNDELGIVVISPFQAVKEYEIKLREETIEELRIKEENDVAVWTTVTLNSNVNEITTNLRAPIVINIRENLGEQILLDKEEYLVKTPLFKEEIEC